MLVSSTDLGQGFTIDTLEDERRHTYYRVCKNSICRYCEDEYMARMYAEAWGWLPAAYLPH